MVPNRVHTPKPCFDVIVVGSGSAGLVAALAAAASGLSVLVLEKTPYLGGTTALSAAGIWVPANHHAAAAGIADSPSDALTYIRAVAPAGWREREDTMWRRFVEAAPPMLTFVERATPLSFALVDVADPHPEAPGARCRGRMLSPRPLSRRVLGSLAHALRPPMLPHTFTYQELLRHDLYHRPLSGTLRLLPQAIWRLMSGARGMGTALVVGLLKGCVDHGVQVRPGVGAEDLVTDPSGCIRGVVVAENSVSKTIHARRGVVLATGGFEGDPERVAIHFPGPVDFITSPNGNTGDGHRMAEAAGAQLSNMDQVNLTPAVPIRYDGVLQGLSLPIHRDPHAIIVDRRGRRFMNEYRFNIGEILDTRLPQDGAPAHLPAWIVADRRFLARSPFVAWFSRKHPHWITRADSVTELARAIGVPADELAGTIDRYNTACARGHDDEFGRLGSQMALICRHPFVALPCNRSFVSTKGGPRTNSQGQVLRADGSIIGGLYCAGVAMANPFGTWAVSTATTLGPNMTWGYICGRSLAGAKGESDG